MEYQPSSSCKRSLWTPPNVLWAYWFLATNLSDFASLYWRLDNPYYHTAQCSPWATGQAGGGWRWGIQLRITINFHNSWLSHVTRWNFDEKCNFFFTLQLRNLLFFYFALDFVFYSCPEQRFTTLHSNWDLLVQLGFNQSHHDDVVRAVWRSENPGGI